jgi:hypothetical protein
LKVSKTLKASQQITGSPERGISNRFLTRDPFSGPESRREGRAGLMALGKIKRFLEEGKSNL